jgi:4-nitrophenyl phosphatase
MRQQFRLGDVQALIVDIDGTLFHGLTPLPGLVRFFTFLHSQGIPFVVASNNATRTAADYRKRLAAQGVQIDVSQILTAAAATARYLVSELGAGASLYVVGEPALHEVLCQAGFVLLDGAGQTADAVVVGGDSSLTYNKLKTAALLLQRGARFVGTNPDLLCPTDEGLVPEAGATLAFLQAATGLSPVVIGKPAQPLFDQAVQALGSRRAETAILGDRLETDIRGGHRAGIKTVLVTTGVDNERTIRQKGVQPDLVVSSLDALVDLWKEEKRHGDSG